MHDPLQDAGLGVRTNQGRAGFRPLSEYIAEVERDPEMKAHLEAARERHRTGWPPGMLQAHRTCPPCDGQCNQGRACPADDGIPEDARSGARMIGLFLVAVALVASSCAVAWVVA